MRRLLGTLSTVLLASCFSPVGPGALDAAGRPDALAGLGSDAAVEQDAGAHPEPDAAQAELDAGAPDASPVLPACAVWVCDAQGQCTVGVRPEGNVCRDAQGPCGLPSSCDGYLLDCPPNTLKVAGQLCGKNAWCDGQSEACPADAEEWQTPTGTGFHWSYPLPSGNTFNAVWSFAPDDAWAVGTQGAAIHWDGRRWTPVPTGTTQHLYRLWATAPNDLWAAGEGDLVLRWNGTAWSTSAISFVGNILGLGGTGASDVWVCGWDKNRAGYAAHWDGIAWSQVGTFGGNSLWVAAPNDVWVAFGNLIHWDGGAWTMSTAVKSADAVWGASQADLWAVGDDGSAYHYDGQAWTLVPTGVKGRLVSVWGTSTNDVWAAGSEAGRRDVLVHWDGTSWTPVEPAATPPSDMADISLLAAVHGSSATDVWAVGAGKILRWNGRSWASSSSPPRPTLNAVWGSSPKDVWAVGEQGYTALHFDGTRWSDSYTYSWDHLTDISGTSASDVWVCGNADSGTNPGTVRHWDGSQWTAVGPSIARVEAIWANSPTDVWVASEQASALYHWDGSAMTTFDVGPARALWGSASNDVWAVGPANTSFHWDGIAWANVPSGTALALHDVWGSGPDDVWAVGGEGQDQGVIVQWNGLAWTEVLSDGSGEFSSVGGSGPNDVWATARLSHWPWNDTVHFDGSGWTSIPGFFGLLHGVWSTGADTWFVGQGGSILRYGL